jgi:cytochrome c
MRQCERYFGFAILTCGIGIANFTMSAATPDAAGGKEIFARRCSGCHAVDSEKEGPRLRGVFGRKAGSVPGFQYSDALRNSGIVWNEPSLNKWLEGPQALVPGNDMEFKVSNADERTALIAYLESLQ